MPDAPSARWKYTLVAMLLVGLPYASLQSMLIPITSDIARAFDVPVADTGWLFSAFLLSSAVCTPLVGRLGDSFGRGRLIVILVVLQIIGVGIAGAAGSLAPMVIGRALQGAGAGLIPLFYGVVQEVFPPKRVGLGIAWISALIGVGGAVGSSLGGIINDALTFRWVFWFPGIFLLLGLAVVTVALPSSSPSDDRRMPSFGSAGLLATAMVSLLTGIQAIGSPDHRLWAPFGLLTGLGLGALWISREMRSTNPLIDVSILARPAIRSANVATLAVGFAFFIPLLAVPLVLQAPDGDFGFGLTPAQAGWLLVPSALGMIVGAPVAAWLLRRCTERGALVVGLVISVLCHAALLWVDSLLSFVLAASFARIGLSVVFACMPNIIVRHVPSDRVSVATSLNALSRTVGSALGTQIVGLIVALLPAARPEHISAPAFQVLLVICVAVALATTCWVLLSSREGRGFSGPSGGAPLPVEP